MTVCKRVVYRGRVQGVGFRATALHLAENFKVTGTVRNGADGSVELVVQGEPIEVNGLLVAVARRMGSYIAGQEVQDVATCPTLRGFHIIT
jgi:acylphosphatase